MPEPCWKLGHDLVDFVAKRIILMPWVEKITIYQGSVCFAVKYFLGNVFRFANVCFVVK